MLQTITPSSKSPRRKKSWKVSYELRRYHNQNQPRLSYKQPKPTSPFQRYLYETNYPNKTTFHHQQELHEPEARTPSKLEENHLNSK